MQNVTALLEELLAEHIPHKLNEPLYTHTSFKIGGTARIFCEPQNLSQLQIALQAARKNHLPCYLLGQGTNLLFEDAGYAGMIIFIGPAFAKIEIQGECLTAQAGALLADVCHVAQRQGLAGMEFAYGIPGSVGGAIYMNAGAYGGEMCDIVENVTYLLPDATVCTAGLEQLALGYRTSVFHHQPWCILSATFKLKKGGKAQIEAQMRDYMSRRASKQPLDVPSAGSAFKRPEGAFAGALIDESGLRGFRVGGAAISQKHCGFIVNVNEATCEDVLSLAEKVAQIVKEKTGYTLEKEIRVVGVDADLYHLGKQP